MRTHKRRTVGIKTQGGATPQEASEIARFVQRWSLGPMRTASTLHRLDRVFPTDVVQCFRAEKRREEANAETVRFILFGRRTWSTPAALVPGTVRYYAEVELSSVIALALFLGSEVSTFHT